MTARASRIAIVYSGDIDRINASGLTASLYNNSMLFSTIPAREWVEDLYLAHDFSAVIVELSNSVAWPLSEPMIDYVTTAPCKPLIALVLSSNPTVHTGFVDAVIDLSLDECSDMEIDAIKLCTAAVHRRSFEQLGMTAEVDNFVPEDFMNEGDVFDAISHILRPDTNRPARSASPQHRDEHRDAGRRVAQRMLDCQLDFG